MRGNLAYSPSSRENNHLCLHVFIISQHFPTHYLVSSSELCKEGKHIFLLILKIMKLQLIWVTQQVNGQTKIEMPLLQYSFL